MDTENALLALEQRLAALESAALTATPPLTVARDAVGNTNLQFIRRTTVDAFLIAAAPNLYTDGTLHVMRDGKQYSLLTGYPA